MSDTITNFSSVQVLPKIMLEEKISHLREKKYNRYFWWRRYQDVEELDDKAPLYQKIINGDYEYPTYYYQAQHEIHRMNEEVSGMRPSEDRLDRINLYMERYRRLMEDAYKEENKRFNAMKKRFSKEFKIDESEIQEVMNDFDGSVEDLYYHFKNKQNEKSAVL